LQGKNPFHLQVAWDCLSLTQTSAVAKYFVVLIHSLY
jgi:hypothetical protein